MANVVITLRVMPSGTETDLDNLKENILDKIKSFTGETDIKEEVEEVAFGLKALKFMFVTDENKGSTEPLEDSIKALEEVSSAEVIDMRRAIG